LTDWTGGLLDEAQYDKIGISPAHCKCHTMYSQFALATLVVQYGEEMGGLSQRIFDQEGI
jgi:hypothetical protein